MAFFAAKPLVQVRSTPESSAVCSTGKEKVRPRWIAGGSLSREGEERDEGISEEATALAESVRNASTESAK